MPDGPALQELVVNLLATACSVQVARVTPETTLEELGIDSLGLTTLAAHLGALYGHDWGQDQLVRLFSADSVGDIIELSRSIVAARPAE